MIINILLCLTLVVSCSWDMWDFCVGTANQALDLCLEIIFLEPKTPALGWGFVTQRKTSITSALNTCLSYLNLVSSFLNIVQCLVLSALSFVLFLNCGCSDVWNLRKEPFKKCRTGQCKYSQILELMCNLRSFLIWGIIGSTLNWKVFLAYFPPHFCNYLGGLVLAVLKSKELVLLFSQFFSY